MRDHIYIIVVSILVFFFTVLFNFFPRSEFSKLEKRRLTAFPEFSLVDLKNGEFTKKISSWYSDTGPYRDVFMLLSMEFNDAIKLKLEDRVSFHAPTTPVYDVDEGAQENIDDVVEKHFDTLDVAVVKKLKEKYRKDEVANVANAGIIVVGTGKNTRALMAFYSKEKSGLAFAKVVNRYRASFPDSINIYCMPIPIASAYYLPESAKNKMSEQWPVFNRIFNALDESVKIVNVYITLGEHIDEPIYLRTDHHWSARGAYYAAQKFAEVAEVPFVELSNYEERVVKDFVGSMYGYSQDISIQKAPEDFYYYMPQGVDYTTTYIDYILDEEYNIIDQTPPYKGKFFHHYKDGSRGVYCTFMGGDIRITKVETSSINNRKLLILKDSYGNALPAFLFHSFSEIHVIDYRYFTRNIKAYVKEKGITDILFANNIQHCCTSSLSRAYNNFLSN